MRGTPTYMIHRWNDLAVAHTACAHCGAPTKTVMPVEDLGQAVMHDFMVECEDCSEASGALYTNTPVRLVGEGGEHAINPGVERLVAWLNAKGFQTTDSGDGEAHDFPCDREGPYVVIVARKGEQVASDLHQRLVELCGRIPPGVQIQYNFSPLDGWRFVDLTGLRDEMIDWGES